MFAELEKQWKQPTFENLDRGVRLAREDDFAWVHGMFAMLLCVTSEKLPTKASTELLKLETARTVVSTYHSNAEAYWQAQGFITRWSPDCLEGIAREMADKLPRDPIVADAVRRILEMRRDVVFADRSLTHGDAMFRVSKSVTAHLPDMFRELLEEDSIVLIEEDFIVTIDRSLNYLSELKKINGYRPFIPLFCILTSLRRAHDVVFGN